MMKSIIDTLWNRYNIRIFVGINEIWGKICTISFLTKNFNVTTIVNVSAVLMGIHKQQCYGMCYIYYIFIFYSIKRVDILL